MASVCVEPRCPNLAVSRGRCPLHGGGRTTAQRGYGSDHQRRRDQLLRQAFGRLCPICGEPMYPDQDLDLNHSVPLKRAPGGVGDQIVHASCNRAEGAAIAAL